VVAMAARFAGSGRRRGAAASFTNFKLFFWEELARELRLRKQVEKLVGDSDGNGCQGYRLGGDGPAFTWACIISCIE
jgi:hypothetical protein